MLSSAALRVAATEAVAPEDREHVTTFIWRRPDRFRISTFPAPAELRYPELRFDVDTPEDLARLETFAALGIDAKASAFVQEARRRTESTR